MERQWPIPSEYALMLQNPPVAFKDSELKQSTIKRDAHNQPWGMAGQFAVVYKATLRDGRHFAVRAFTSPNEERSERYSRISAYLNQKSHLKSLVQFHYEEKGIRASDGKMYPMVRMEWVQGQTLFEWLRLRCEDRNQRDLGKLADDWISMISELRAARIAHGDLQHANVMVTEKSELKLVDYDCMCVPDLEGRRNLEIGVEPYQHPTRDGNTLLSASLDNFSSIFIYLGIRALAASPRLWDKYVKQPNYDKLLFRRQDFETPASSDLYQELLRSPDKEVGRITKELFELSRASIDQVPNLEAVLISWDQVRSLLTQRHFGEAVEILEGRGRRVADAPADLQPGLTDAVKRVECRKKTRAAIDKGDEQEMLKLFNSKLLDDFPAAKPERETASQAARILETVARLQQAKKQNDLRNLVKLWDTDRGVLEKRNSTSGWKTEIDAARQRNQGSDEVRKLVTQTPVDVTRLKHAWETLQKLGGHPEVESHRDKIEQIIAREVAWSKYSDVPAAQSETNDKQRYNAWNESLFTGWPTAERERQGYNESIARLKRLKQLQTAVAANPAAATLEGEQAIVQAAQSLTVGYKHSLENRVQEAIGRLRGHEKLLSAIKTNGPEATIVAAADDLSRLNAISLVDHEGQQRVNLARQRAPVLTALKALDLNQPVEQRDQRLLAAWRDDLLKGCSEADPWRNAHTEAVNRRKVLDQLRSAVEKRQEETICQLMANPLLNGFPLPREWQGATQEALKGNERRSLLLQACQTGNVELFAENFDPQLIRQAAAKFESFQLQIEEWTKQGILPRDRMGLRPSMGGPSLQPMRDRGPHTWRARWIWPKRFSVICILAVCRHTPKAGAGPENFGAVQVERMTLEQYERASGRVLHVKSEWSGHYVAVWASIDLGFKQFLSEPLVLGRLGT